MILVINTADSEKVFIGLVENKAWLAKKEFAAKAKQAEKLLLAIEKMLGKSKPQAIAVVSGPASFTALRIGVVTANALAWSFGAKVFGIKLTEFSNLEDLAQKVSYNFAKKKNERIVKPFYGGEPNITLKK